MPTTKKKAHVRLTDNAHTILTGLADKYSISQKEIASEAIIWLVKREAIMKEATLTIRRLKKIRNEAIFWSIALGVFIGMAFSVVIGLFWGVF